MQELLLKTCTSSAWRKEVWNETFTESCIGQDCMTLSALADQPLRQLWKKRRHRTSSNKQCNHRHLRRKCHWMTWTRVLYVGPSPACTPWIRFCQPLITSEQSSNRVLVTLAARVVFSKSSFIWCLLTQAVGESKSADGETRCSPQQDQIPSHGQGVQRGGLHSRYTKETFVHTSHAVPKCWQDSTSGLKIPFSKGN